MKKFILACFSVLSLFAYSIEPSAEEEFKMFRDDALAALYAPLIVQPDSIPAEPEMILYRMARSNDGGKIVMAFHVVWPFEKDNRKGFYPWWTRVTYTGGLKLQKVIYGPGDVEAVEIVLDRKSNKIINVRYETADWDQKGGVIHVHVEKNGCELPSQSNRLVFRVVSWNHMFDLIEESDIKSGEKLFDLPVGYFSHEDWNYYGMTKKKQTWLKRDRAHFEWETGPLP